MPEVDFSQFGEVEEKPMGRLLKMGATNLHRSWLNVPHVTQFDEADITELENFRKAMKAEAEAQGAKLTPLPFLVKACAFALVPAVQRQLERRRRYAGMEEVRPYRYRGGYAGRSDGARAARRR